MNLPQLTLGFFCPEGEVCHVASRRMRGQTLIHWHDFTEVFWMEEGACVHIINGERQFLPQGSLVTMRAKDYHGFESPPGGASFKVTNVAFQHQTLDFFRQRYFIGSTTYFWAATTLPFSLQLNPSQLNRLNDAAYKLLQSARNHLAIDHFLLELFLELHTQSPLEMIAPDWLEYALKEIRDPRHFIGGTARFARLAGRSPQHVNSALKKFYGLTATDAVNRARMEHAAAELMMTTKKIVEIGLECGFQNLGHFYKVFHQFHGVTPRHYRERQRSLLPK